MKKLILIIALTSCLLTVKGQERYESPFSIFGDHTPVLDIEHAPKPSDILVSVVLPDASVVQINVADKVLCVYDSEGELIHAESISSTGIAMFTTTDPRAAEMPWVSPYSYCFDNPVNLVDRDGMRPSPYESALMAAISYDDIFYGDEDANINVLRKSGWDLSHFST